MAVTVRHLYESATKLYNIRLVAGERGINRLVQWVHIIEDHDVSKFLHGQEFVLTTGVLARDCGQLLKFAENLYNADASAFLVNLGPYVENVPKEIMEYCNEVEMPFFVMPWETPMVDVTRDFCYKIMKHDSLESNISSTLKNIVYRIGDIETQIQQMERNGFDRDSSFTFVAMSVMFEEHTKGYQGRINDVMRCAEQAARSIHESFISFKHKDAIVCALINYSDKDIHDFVRELEKLLKWKMNDKANSVRIGISGSIQGISHQEENLENAMAAMFISGKKGMVQFYNELDIYKLLYSVREKNVLREFYHDYIGKIAEYDRENNTNLLYFIKTYIKNNGKQHLVAEELYIHRNTVTHQLKKIEKIIGEDPTEVKTQSKLYLGLCIGNMMK